MIQTFVQIPLIWIAVINRDPNWRVIICKLLYGPSFPADALGPFCPGDGHFVAPSSLRFSAIQFRIGYPSPRPSYPFSAGRQACA